MRIENVSGQRFTAPSGQGGEKASLSQLKRGDSFTAKVLGADAGTATLKLADGQIVKAKVEGGAQLFPGQDVEMQVAGNDEGTLTLRVIETMDGGEEASSTRIAPAQVGDERQALAATSLKNLNLPVTRETVAATLRIMEKYPELGPEKAAFLAASGIPEEMLTPQAVARLFSADTGDMMSQLSGLLDEAAAEAPLPSDAPAASPEQAPARQGELAAQTQAGEVQTQAGEARPVPASAGEPAAPPSTAGEVPVPGAAPVPQSAAPDIGGQGVPSQTEAVPPPQTGSTAQAPAAPPQTEAPAAVQSAPIQEGEAPPHRAPLSGEQSPSPAQAPAREGGATQASPSAAQATARLGAAVELVRQFAENPQLFASGEGRLAAFAQMFQEAAEQVAHIVAAPAEEQGALLKDFIDKMFVSIDKWQDDAPGLVKKAREELLTRLTLVQEAVSGTGLENRAEVARQARGLAEHVRLLEEINQFGYVQIPVSQGGKQKTAEMYIYRDKRRGKRIDADNVKILLALDTQSMGHLQAFVSIRQKEVSVRLDVGRQQWADYIRMRSPELHSMLAEAGYRLAENRIGVREEPVSVEKAMSALLEYDARPAGLDLKI